MWQYCIRAWVKVFCKCKGFEKSQFYKINKELRRGDLVLKQNGMDATI